MCAYGPFILTCSTSRTNECTFIRISTHNYYGTPTCSCPPPSLRLIRYDHHTNQTFMLLQIHECMCEFVWNKDGTGEINLSRIENGKHIHRESYLLIFVQSSAHQRASLISHIDKKVQIYVLKKQSNYAGIHLKST